MSDSHLSELAQRLVVGHKRDGRSIYGEQAKRELILACCELGAFLAKVARACGVNANQLARWVRHAGHEPRHVRLKGLQLQCFKSCQLP